MIALIIASLALAAGIDCLFGNKLPKKTVTRNDHTYFIQKNRGY